MIMSETRDNIFAGAIFATAIFTTIASSTYSSSPALLPKAMNPYNSDNPQNAIYSHQCLKDQGVFAEQSKGKIDAEKLLTCIKDKYNENAKAYRADLKDRYKTVRTISKITAILAASSALIAFKNRPGREKSSGPTF